MHKKIPTLSVNMNAKCKCCGKGGAVNNSGVCMKCIAKAVKRGGFDHLIKKEATND